MNSMAGKSNEMELARALTWRYIVAFALIASLSTAAWLSLHLVISEQKSTAAVVNVSGRQRMLSQRTALFANLLVSSPQSERAVIRGKLQAAIGLMEKSHHGLTQGDASMGLPDTLSRTVRALYFAGENPLHNQVEAYISTVRAYLMLSDEMLRYDHPLLSVITQTAPGPLVEGLDRMVRQYQMEGETAVRRLQNAETIFWLVTLLLLILEAQLIFRPFTRHVKTIIDRLRETGDELMQHQNHLEELVKQRTEALEKQRVFLSESEEKFRLISTAAKDAIVIVGRDERVTYWNPAAQIIFGYSSEEATGKNLHNLITPERYRTDAHSGFERFIRHGTGEVIGKTFEIDACNKSGVEFPVELSISAFNLQNNWFALGIIRDITERKEMEEQVRRLAFYDPLTQLPNRRMLNDRLSQALAHSKRTGRYGALMFIDLDNFKPLNDQFGHGAGDLLLIEVAQRLKHSMRQMDSVARFGGDEFVVMLGELEDDKVAATHQAMIVAQKILAMISEPYKINNGEQDIVHRCSASIGVCMFINHEAREEDLLKWADMAMYQAKESGRNTIRFCSKAG